MKVNYNLSQISAIKEFVKKRRELQLAVAVYRWIRCPDLVYERLRVKRFRNYHRGRRRCFLVGNGSSIRYQDLTQLRGEVVFVTNSFVLHSQYEEIVPTYYCVSDPNFFLGGVNPEFGHLMKQKAHATVKFFPLSAKKAVKRSGLFHGNSIYYLNYIGIPIWKTGRMNLDISKEVYTGDSVIIDFCLPLAFYMGFSEIYLVGCDMDYGLDQAEDFSRGYFYDARLTTASRQTVKYLKKEWYENVIASYMVARRIFEQEGRKIYNATLGGKLEVFERVDLEKILEVKTDD